MRVTGDGSKRSEARVRWQIPVGAASLCLALGGLGLLFSSGGGSLPRVIEPDAVAAALTDARATVPAADREAYVLAPATSEPAIEADLTQEPTPEPTPESRVFAASNSGIRTLPPPPPVATPTPAPPTPTPTQPPLPTATVPTVEPTAAPSETAVPPGSLPGPSKIDTNEPGVTGLGHSGGISAAPIAGGQSLFK